MLDRPDPVRHVHTDPPEALPAVPRPPRASAPGEVSAAASTSPACSSTHSKGYQMLYVYPSDATSRLSSLQSVFLADAAAAQDRIAAESASAPKRPRFFCGITAVKTNRPGALYTADPLPQILDDLALAGHNRSDRKYLLWWDGPNHPFACGEGTFADDDRSSPSQNYNNTGPDWAVVYKPPGGGSNFCGWTTVLHEIGHTLGSVMHSAPNATGQWHCRDENDVMCYVDNSGLPTFEACPGTYIRFDCNGDDYFNPSPAAGSYLATHWNTYNSSWLETAPAPSAPDTTITGGPSGSGNAASATFTFTSTIAGSTFTCSLDGAPGQSCTSPKSYSGLADGSHTFTVYATANGVSDPTPASRTWSVGAGGGSSPVPDTSITVKPSSPTKETTALFQFTSTVAGAAFTCTLDGGTPFACSSPQSFTGLAEGPHTFTVAATAGGQPDPSPASHAWTVDTVAPVVTLTAPNVAIQGARSFRVEWAVQDDSEVPVQRVLVRSASTAQQFGWWSVWREQSSPGATFIGGAGWTYCFVIEVFDAAGNRAVNVGQSCTAVPLDDRWTPARGFERRTENGFFDNSASIARSSGATMTLSNIRAREIDMRVQMCRACRYIDVYWNGQRIKQMSLWTNDPAIVSVRLASFSSLQTGTLQLRIVSPVIVIDSIGVSQY
ncbi:MAG TPA: hypothetical protein VM841_11515 [Actinomycetota bacterium]|nr:hypothetical protein [Actinomycetota bacterium]